MNKELIFWLVALVVGTLFILVLTDERNRNVKFERFPPRIETIQNSEGVKCHRVITPWRESGIDYESKSDWQCLTSK